MGLSDQEFCLVYAGRLSPEKGPDLLIDALGRLPAELWSRLRVVIAGDGLLRAEMENRVRAAKLDGTVRFLGRISNVAGLYNAADLVAVPSRAECFGLSLVEAMASGCAVVATAIGGMREIVDEPQEGLLVHPAVERVVDESAGQAFFGDPMRMHRDLLADAQAPTAA